MFGTMLVMKIKDWLHKSTQVLSEAQIDTARLDSLVLMADALNKDKSWIFAHSDQNLKSADVSKLDQQIIRRSGHEPLAYIRGIREFYGREFIVSKDTLVPRPESEMIIELLKELAAPIDGQHNTVIIDVGTGSGALAITAKLEMPILRVVATDVSPTALEIATKNARKLNAKIEFLEGNLLEPLDALKLENTKIIVIANLPYVPENYTINRAAMHEPKIAIFGGNDGLDLYRELFLQIANNLQFEGANYVLCESLSLQHEDLAIIAGRSGFTLQKINDLVQVYSSSRKSY
jgi:release factor glutamine methyltransferase